MSVRIGVDLGGTKIEIIALAEDGSTLVRRRIPTPAGDYAATIEAIATLVESVERELQCEARVGIGTPGTPSRRTGLMKNANSTVLIGKPLEADLTARLGRAIRMTNDANCFTLSEAADGAAADARVVFGVILGTGVGGGIAVEKRILEGHGIAGEWGHNPLPWPQPGELPGELCYCGKRGCMETFLSGPSLTREYIGAGGERISPSEIDQRANGGDERALAVLRTYEDRLARGLATVINVLDPDAVVFGGGVSNLCRLYETLPNLLPKYVFSDAVDTRLHQAAHGDSSGVRGAAMLW